MPAAVETGTGIEPATSGTSAGTFLCRGSAFAIPPPGRRQGGSVHSGSPLGCPVSSPDGCSLLNPLSVPLSSSLDRVASIASASLGAGLQKRPSAPRSLLYTESAVNPSSIRHLSTMVVLEPTPLGCLTPMACMTWPTSAPWEPASWMQDRNARVAAHRSSSFAGGDFGTIRWPVVRSLISAAASCGDEAKISMP